ncbi:MAG: hypothetical protein AAFQ14_12195 [Cyanobacteria bacterium J06621_12]
MTTDEIALAQKIQSEFEKLQAQQRFDQIARLITSSFEILPRRYNLQIFGYIPGIFRQIEIENCAIEASDIYLDEPVIYKLYFRDRQELYNLPYFYLFCYLKSDSRALNVYFQSANHRYKNLAAPEYNLASKKVSFEGSNSAFKSNSISVISISDPGHFMPGLTSSFYVGSKELNFNKTIAEALESICHLSNIKLNDTMLFGSSAGTMGALLSSTYLKCKANVLAVNSQINLHYREDLMQSIFNITQPRRLLNKFGNQVSCTYRFNQDITSIPNIYILANVNDYLYQRNFDFYQQYISRFTEAGINNQSVFDSYYGVEGHGRPEANSLKAKIKIAREVLTMKSNINITACS